MGQRYDSDLSDDDSPSDEPPVDKTDGIDPELQHRINEYLDNSTDHPTDPDTEPDPDPEPDTPTDPSPPSDPPSFADYTPPDTPTEATSLDGPDCYTSDTFDAAHDARTNRPPDPTPDRSDQPRHQPDRLGVSDRQTERVYEPTPTDDTTDTQPPADVDAAELSNAERMRREERETDNPTADHELAADAGYSSDTAPSPHHDAPDSQHDIGLHDRTVGQLIDDDITTRLDEPDHVTSDRDRMDVAGPPEPRPAGSTLAQQERIEARETSAAEHRQVISEELDRYGPEKAAARREHLAKLHRQTHEPTRASNAQASREFYTTLDPLLSESLRTEYPDGGDRYDEVVDYVADRTDASRSEADAAVSKVLAFNSEFDTVTPEALDHDATESIGIAATVDASSIDGMTTDLQAARNAAIAILDPQHDDGQTKPETMLWNAKQNRDGETGAKVTGRVKHVETDVTGDGLEKIMYVEPEHAPVEMPDVKVSVYSSHEVVEDASPGAHQTDDVRRSFDPDPGAVVEVAGSVHRYEGFDEDHVDADAQPAMNLTKGTDYDIIEPADTETGSGDTGGQTPQNRDAITWRPSWMGGSTSSSDEDLL